MSIEIPSLFSQPAVASAELPPLNLSVDAGQADGTVLISWSRDITVGSWADRRERDRLEQDLNQPTWVGTLGGYVVQLTPAVAVWLHERYPGAKYDETADLMCRAARAIEEQARRRAAVVSKFLETGEPPETPALQFKRKPMNHQIVGAELMRQAPFLGILWEMGTGKTKCAADALSALAREKWAREHKPLRALIICPRSVIINWVRELTLDVTVDYRVVVGTYIPPIYQAELEASNFLVHTGWGDVGAAEALVELVRHNGVPLQIYLLNYDALKGRCDLLKHLNWDVGILDEAHRIKSYSAKRTRYALDLALKCDRRYIMTGTPYTQSPLDLFPQFEFLSPKQGLLGHTTFYAYQQAYCRMGGYGGRAVVENLNRGGLLSNAAKWSFTMKKEQCLDLPEKTYEARSVQMTAQQREIYDQVATEVLLVLESLGAEMTIQNVLVQYLRLAQVTAGYIKSADGREVPIPGAQVKLDELVELLEEENWPKTVIWCRFVHEVNDVCERLAAKGIKHVSHMGATSQLDRQRAIDAFQQDEQVRSFVGTPSSGGIGINLTAAELVVYPSNSFSLTERLQSEDRVHRKGLRHPVTYTDITCEDSIDELVLERLLKKRESAEYFSNPLEIASSLREFLSAGLRARR